MQYKLTYWDVRGRAEAIRILFAAANVEYLDNRIKKESWPALKPSMPWGQVPVLEFDNKVLAQSVSICRYLARKFNFVGSDEWESAKCDEIVDSINDVTNEMKKSIHEKDEALKSKYKTDFLNVIMPKFLGKLESILANKKGQFIVGQQLTWADICVAVLLDRLENPAYGSETLLKEYPYLKQMKKATYDYPGIKEWIEKRPVE